jgi:hypothetical protein
MAIPRSPPRQSDVKQACVGLPQSSIPAKRYVSEPSLCLRVLATLVGTGWIMIISFGVFLKPVAEAPGISSRRSLLTRSGSVHLGIAASQPLSGVPTVALPE